MILGRFRPGRQRRLGRTAPEIAGWSPTVILAAGIGMSITRDIDFNLSITSGGSRSQGDLFGPMARGLPSDDDGGVAP